MIAINYIEVCAVCEASLLHHNKRHKTLLIPYLENILFIVIDRLICFLNEFHIFLLKKTTYKIFNFSDDNPLIVFFFVSFITHEYNTTLVNAISFFFYFFSIEFPLFIIIKLDIIFFFAVT